MVVTIRSPDGQGGFHDDNIIVWTTDPEGDWSLPITLTDQPAVIDPSLFFDDDGRVWYMANARVADEPYPGYRDIWLQELDMESDDKNSLGYSSIGRLFAIGYIKGLREAVYAG